MTAELAERERPQAARAKPGRGAPKGRPRCGASWTAAAAWAMQEVFLYNIGKGGPVWSGGVLFFAPGGRVRNRMGQRENPRQASEQLY